jgi:cell division protein FtsA
VERSLVLGIDTGSAQVIACLAEVVDGEPQVIGLACVPSLGVRKGVVVDLNTTAEAIHAAVTKACEMAGRPMVNQVVVGVSGSHILSLIGSAEVAVHRPSVGVTPEDLRRVLDNAAKVDLPAGRDIIHVVPRAYRLDDSDPVLDPIGLAGRTLHAEAHLITAESLPLQNHLRAVSMASLVVVDYQVSIRVAGESVLTPAERNAGVLLLQMGATTTGVAVYDRGYLWHVSVLPIGGEHITGDIASLLRMPVAVAEKVKLERGWAATDLAPDTAFELVSPSGQNVRELTDKSLAQIIEPRVQEILQMAAAQVKRSGYTGLFPSGVVLTGGSAKLQGMVAVAADCLDLPARIGTPTGAFIGEPEFATVAGLVRWGARLAQDEAAAAVENEKRDKWGRVTYWLKGLFR